MRENIQIERMAFGPEAIGHLASGKTVFVANAAPGDIAEIEVYEEKPSYAKARMTNLLEPSRARDAKHGAFPPDLAMSALAPWSHLTYAAQLELKEDNVKNALSRTAHLSTDVIDGVCREIVPSELQWGYRNKLEFAVEPGKDGRVCIGMHVNGTDELIPIKEALLGNSLLRKSPAAIQGALRYLCGNDDMGIYRAGIRASENTESIELALWTPPSSFPRSFTAKVFKDALKTTSVVRVIADPGSSRKVKRVEVLGGDGFWHERMVDEGVGYDFRVSAPSFFQVNTLQAQNLVELALKALGPLSGARIADLYSGAGTFSIPMAAMGADVIAVELEGSSSRDFRRNVELNGVDAEMVCDDVSRALPMLEDLDAAIVDPPRAGLDKRVINGLSETSIEKLVYISCDVQTLARDIERLQSSGFMLAEITPVDMFPQTYHAECVSVFARV